MKEYLYLKDEHRVAEQHEEGRSGLVDPRVYKGKAHSIRVGVVR